MEFSKATTTFVTHRSPVLFSPNKMNVKETEKKNQQHILIKSVNNSSVQATTHVLPCFFYKFRRPFALINDPSTQ